MSPVISPDTKVRDHESPEWMRITRLMENSASRGNGAKGRKGRKAAKK